MAIEDELAAVICIEDPLREEAAGSDPQTARSRIYTDRHDDRRQRPYSQSNRSQESA